MTTPEQRQARIRRRIILAEIALGAMALLIIAIVLLVGALGVGPYAHTSLR